MIKSLRELFQARRSAVGELSAAIPRGRCWALGLLSAGLFYLAFPPSLIDIAGCAAVLPIVWVCLNGSVREAAACAFVASLGLVPSLVCFLGPSPFVGGFAIVLTIGSIVLAGGISASASQGRGRWHALWIVPLTFVALEHARSLLFPPYLGFHAVGTGAVASDGTVAVTCILPAFGVHGLSAAILVSATLGAILMGLGRGRTERMGAFALAIGLPALICTSFSFGAGESRSQAAGFVVTGIQSDRSSLSEFTVLSRFTDLLPIPSDLLVWPAGVSEYDPLTNPASLAAIHDALGMTGIPLLMGFHNIDSFGDRTNSAAIWHPNGAELIRFSQVAPDWGSGFVPGEAPVTFEIDTFEIGLVIGTDIDHPNLIRRLVNDGAELVVAIGDDPIEWSEVGLLHHLTAIRIRAAEMGRDVFRVSSVGISALARPAGHHFVFASVASREFVSAPLIRRTGRTFYVRAGWLFPWLALAGFAILLGFDLVRRRQAV
jgi:apolipoprotein N-acyltransferase